MLQLQYLYHAKVSWQCWLKTPSTILDVFENRKTSFEDHALRLENWGSKIKFWDPWNFFRGSQSGLSSPKSFKNSQNSYWTRTRTWYCSCNSKLLHVHGIFRLACCKLHVPENNQYILLRTLKNTVPFVHFNMNSSCSQWRTCKDTHLKNYFFPSSFSMNQKREQVRAQVCQTSKEKLIPFCVLLNDLHAHTHCLENKIHVQYCAKRMQTNFATFWRNITQFWAKRIFVRTSSNFRNAYCFSKSENSCNFCNGRPNFRAKFHGDITKFSVLVENSQWAFAFYI